MVAKDRKFLRVPGMWWAACVFAGSLGLALAAWYTTKTATEARAQAQFDFTTNEIANAIADRLQDYEQTLWGGAGLLASLPTATLAQWVTYVDGLKIQERLPGIQGIAFAKAISPSEEDAHIREVRTEGVFANYDIQPQGARELSAGSRYTT
jgi:CHASE1-domain containing sensor protein